MGVTSIELQAGRLPLDWPHYGIGPVAAFARGFRKYATFSGRASRSEYWWWSIGYVLVAFVPGGLAVLVTFATEPLRSDGSRAAHPVSIALLIVMMALMLAGIVPSIALSVRRLHDVGYSGLLYLLCFIPYLGSLIVTVLCSLPTNPYAAAALYGPPSADIRFDKRDYPAGARPPV